MRTTGDGRLELAEDFTICIVPSLEWFATVPAGYVTDGASIPRWLWPFVGPPMRAKYLPAAIVHDYLCDEAHRFSDYELRVMADAVFFLLLERFRVGYLRRAAMYLGVRCWGRVSFKRVTK